MRAVSAELELPLPTNKTEVGPKLVLERGFLSIWWDHVEGSHRRSAMIVFREVLACEYRQAATCGEDAITGSRTFLQMGESPWLAEVTGLWKEYIVM